MRVRLADRPALRAGTDEVWDRAERDLRETIDASGMPYALAPGEGAFYGPKLEFHLRDTIGRSWQCGTLQLDFILPERLDASYIGEDGQKHRPVMLHRAIFGSMERFIGVMIENYAGRFPLWLAPVQVVVATITSDADAYAQRGEGRPRRRRPAVEIDLRNEKINYKVREHSLAKVPVMLVVGKREAENDSVAMRRLGVEKQEILALDEAVNRLKAEARLAGGPSLTFRTKVPVNNKGVRPIARSPMDAAPSRDGPRINAQITVPSVRLVKEDGTMVGVTSLREALAMAAEAGLDLVEISPNADPPVCKILDFGKFKYEVQKKRNEARKKQKVIDVKEIKLRPGIDEHDYDVKMRAVSRFLEEGDKVKVTMRFRGREMVHQELGAQVLERVRTQFDAAAKVEQFPRLEGRQMVMVLAPR